MKPAGSSPYSQKLTTSPYPEPDQSIPSPRLLLLFRNMVKFLRGGVLSTSPNPQAVGPPLVGCPRLLIQNIRSCPPYLETVSPSATWGRAMPWWQGPTYSPLVARRSYAVWNRTLSSTSGVQISFLFLITQPRKQESLSSIVADQLKHSVTRKH